MLFFLFVKILNEYDSEEAYGSKNLWCMADGGWRMTGLVPHAFVGFASLKVTFEGMFLACLLHI